jgi:hypothetical protein
MQAQNNKCEDNNKNMYEQQQQQRWPTFLICVAIIEIIIAVVAATGMGLNVLATSNGVADIKLVNTSAVIGKYYAHASMKTDGYQFTGHLQDVNSTDSRFYSYKTAYQNTCGKTMPSAHSNRDCKLRYAVWQWTRAYTALGTIAIIIVFITGIVLLLFSCFGECLTRCCRSRDNDMDNDGSCWWNFCSCTTELWLLMLNLLVFILFAFSWGIILGLKFNHHLKGIIATDANLALNRRRNLQTYDFTFHTIRVGRSLWPVAVASLLSLILSFYLLVMICVGCCRNCSCDNCDEKMKCNNHYRNDNRRENNYNNKNSYNNKHNYQRTHTKNTTIEMACNDVEV